MQAKSSGAMGLSPKGRKSTLSLEAFPAYVPTNRLPAYRYANGVRSRVLRYWLRQVALLTQLAHETRNFHHRIATTLRSRLFDRGVDLGPIHERLFDGSYRECSETRARTEDMLRLANQKPHLTCLDTDLFVSGWNAGARFHAGGNSGT
jgi:signal transduction histidine kinase